MKSKNNLVLSILLATPFLLGSFFLFNDNPARALAVIFVLAIFVTISYFRSTVLASIVSILVALPFNIVYQIPSSLLSYSSTVLGVNVNYLVPTLSILDILGIFLFVSLIFEIVKNVGWRALLTSRTVWILYAMFGYFFVQSLVIREWLVVINDVRYFILFGSVVLFAGFFRNIRSVFDGQSNFILISSLVINITALKQASIGLIQFLQGSSLGLSSIGESVVAAGLPGVSSVDLVGNEYLRAYGMFPHPNMLAAYLVIIIFTNLFVLELYRGVHYKIVRVFRYAFSIILSALLLFTFSRTAIVVLGIVWLAYLLRGPILKLASMVKSKNVNTVSGFLIIDRFKSIFSEGEYSVVDRMVLSSAAISIIGSNLLFGVGTGRFVRYLAEIAPTTSGGFLLLQPVHNIFLLFLAEQGLLISLIVLTGVSVAIFRLLKTATAFARYSIAISFVMILFFGMFDHFFLTLPQGIVLLCIVVIEMLIVVALSRDNIKVNFKRKNR